MNQHFNTNLNEVEIYMHQKGQEYRTIDKSRARRIYEKLKAYIKPPKYTIQILGTNGKGSMGRFLALALMQNNAQILHFTSPHIFTFNERFYMQGAIISNDTLTKAHRFLQKFDFINECSYFEYATFLALVLAQEIDYLILEAGVGGELDSTSVVKRDLCVFSVIDYDHTEILGKSIEEIATTKLNAVFYPNKVPKMILGIQKYNIVEKIAENIAKVHSVELYCLNSIHESQGFKVHDSIKSYLQKYNLASFLAQNLALALKVMEILGLKYDLTLLSKLDLRARFEQIAPNIIVDVGHNQNAANEIKQNLKSNKVILVYNSYFQKNISEILGILKDNILHVEILKVADNPRIIKQKTLENTLMSLGIAYQNFSGIDSQKNYLVFGSFSVVETFMRWFMKQNGVN